MTRTFAIYANDMDADFEPLWFCSECGMHNESSVLSCVCGHGRRLWNIEQFNLDRLMDLISCLKPVGRLLWEYAPVCENVLIGKCGCGQPVVFSADMQKKGYWRCHARFAARCNRCHEESER